MASAHAKVPFAAAQTLLVVDDREANLIAMKALLQNGDWNVRTAISGVEALQCLLEDDVGLVLLDVQMPEMDGFEVARLMRGNSRTRFTPIIFISAVDHTSESVMRGYATGAVDFIHKPFNPQVLRHKVSSLLDHERSRRDLQLLTQQLESERAFNASVLENAAEGILVVNDEGVIDFANSAIAQMLQCQVTQLQGTRLLDHIETASLESTAWKESQIYEHWRRGMVYRLHDAFLRIVDDGLLPVALSCSPLSRQQRSMVVIVLDMSVVHNLHAQLESQAVTDALTTLPNRRGFDQALEAALARNDRNGKYLAVLYLDLDGFKRINDSLGHAAGDEVLKRVADQLQKCLRPYDILARMGGDEFTALLDSLDHPEDAARVAEKLIEAISIRYKVDGMEVTLGASIGIACFPDSGRSVDAMLRAADMAMYEAKRAGRQQYRFFSPEMNGRARSRLMVEESLRVAIEQNEFALVYQPQIYLESGRLRGFEALLRWQHRVAGSVSPGVFIPLLEETRLINRLGGWIFRQGVSQCQTWPSFSQGLVVSLNVSPVQFSMPQLVEDLRRVIEQEGLSPAQVEVEVTEGALMADLENTREQLRQLRQLGVKIAIDDFGTGYSSLAYLRHFELDTLKIDRLFISNMLDSPKDAAVVSTIINLGRELGLEVIAEGVETIAQRDWLIDHQCHIMQGFLVSPGLPVDKAREFPLQIDWSDLPHGISN
ncbi:EAL domain-containing protein [Pseudomonas sp. PS02288]|uniref:putative bifunctional diguanylate cyclase/phosphodiesterase n=1 Tax=Pseudomonas sp. PS02288 TaxID=2991443 RepID=UPI00249AC814|nr:EAL domain-containing protein [Pseudomonas sp. PS02288]